MRTTAVSHFKTLTHHTALSNIPEASAHPLELEKIAPYKLQNTESFIMLSRYAYSNGGLEQLGKSERERKRIAVSVFLFIEISPPRHHEAIS